VLKQNLGGHKFKDDPKADTAVIQYLLLTGNIKLVPYYECLNCVGDYVEKQWDSSTIKSAPFVTQLKVTKKHP